MKNVNISLDDLNGNQHEIAEVIGIDSYIKLSKYFGGEYFYIYKNILNLSKYLEIMKYENCVRKDTVHQNLRKCITYQQDISV